MDDLQYSRGSYTLRFISSAVLNLVINGWPSILWRLCKWVFKDFIVLNLVINGWPSIRQDKGCWAYKQEF